MDWSIFHFMGSQVDFSQNWCILFNLAKSRHPGGMRHYRLHFTRVLTVCERTCLYLGVPSIQRANTTNDSSISKFIMQTTCQCIYLLDWSHKTDSQNITAPEVIQLFVLNFK